MKSEEPLQRREKFSDPLDCGAILGGRYEIISKLGSGGMGVVYKVRQQFFGTFMALKTLSHETLSETAVRRFQIEARTSVSLKHPNIIGVYDFGVFEDSTPFLAMEFIEGQTLADRIRHGAIPANEAIPIFVQACFGLHYAHERGVVHRDVKPSNLILVKHPQPDELVKILDFGIAKSLLTEAEDLQALTRTGEIFGSPLYMSPEQCSGFRVDQRADIYSLGCVFFEALTGCPPFVGDTALSTMLKHQQQQPPSLREASLGGRFPDGLEEIVAGMLEKDVKSRYQSLAEVANALGNVARGEKVYRPHSGSPKRSAVGNQSIVISRKILALSVTTLVMISVATGLIAYFAFNKNNQPALSEHVTVTSPNKDAPLLADGKLPDVNVDFRTTTPAFLRQKLEQASSKPPYNLELSWRDLDDEAMAMIAKSPKLAEILLVNCKFTPGGLERLTALKLTDLTLTGCGIDNKFAGILPHFRRLKTLVLGSNPELSDDAITGLSQLKNIKHLDLANTPITDRSLNMVGKMCSLEHLILDHDNGITSGGISFLENSPVVILNLTGCRIDDAALKSLGMLRNLAVLGLSRTNVSLSGVTEICGRRKKILRVALENCPKISQAELRVLHQRFPQIDFSEYRRDR